MVSGRSYVLIYFLGLISVGMKINIYAPILVHYLVRWYVPGTIHYAHYLHLQHRDTRSFLNTGDIQTKSSKPSGITNQPLKKRTVGELDGRPARTSSANI